MRQYLCIGIYVSVYTCIYRYIYACTWSVYKSLSNQITKIRSLNVCGYTYIYIQYTYVYCTCLYCFDNNSMLYYIVITTFTCICDM